MGDNQYPSVVSKIHNEFGALHAVKRFLKETDCFKIDRNRQKWFYTNNIDGFLARIK